MRSMSIAYCLIALLLLCGCDRPSSRSRRQSVSELRNANRQLRSQVDSQGKTIFQMGAALLLLGVGLSITLGALSRKGGASSLRHTPPARSNIG